MTKTLAYLSRVGLSFAVLAIPMMAQESADAPPPQNFLGLIWKAGGPAGAVIGIMSIIGVGLIIEHFMNVTRDKLAPPEMIDELQSLLDGNEVQAAYDLCDQNPNYLTNVVGAALPKLSSGYESMEQAAADVGEEEAIKLHAKISWLSLIGNISPMCGLLGTVMGMLKAFGVIERETSPSPAKLAGGIKEALITTMLGLVVAIPMMIGFFFFRNRVVRIILEISAISEDLLDRFRPQHQG